MPCSHGCCDTPAEHWRSLHVRHPEQKDLKKVRRDHHDGGAFVDVTDHWHDRQDVNVHPVMIEGIL